MIKKETAKSAGTLHSTPSSSSSLPFHARFKGRATSVSQPPTRNNPGSNDVKSWGSAFSPFHPSIIIQSSSHPSVPSEAIKVRNPGYVPSGESSLDYILGGHPNLLIVPNAQQPQPQLQPPPPMYVPTREDEGKEHGYNCRSNVYMYVSISL